MEQLTEWAESYLRHKDLLAKKINNIKNDNNTLIIKKNTGQELAICTDNLEDVKINNKAKTYIFATHTKQNFETLCNRWNELNKFPELILVFADTKNNKKWILFHSHIARLQETI